MTLQPHAGPVHPSRPTPGWYPDPRAAGIVRWWDGGRWTEHVQAMAQQAPAPQVVIYQQGGRRQHVSGLSHGGTLMHLTLTVLTCGLWLPIWLIREWLGRRSIR